MNYKKLAEEFKSYLDDNFIDNEIKKDIKKEINKSFVRCMFPDIKLAIGVYFTEYSIKFYGVFSNDLLGSNSLYLNFLNELNGMDSIFKFYTSNINGRDLFFYKYVFYCKNHNIYLNLEEVIFFCNKIIEIHPILEKSIYNIILESDCQNVYTEIANKIKF